MALSGFQLRRLTLVGTGVPPADIEFFSGLNVISGPSDTGKTFIVQCLDFMLGAKDGPKTIPESTRYHSAQLIILANELGDEFTLERSLKGGDFKLIKKGDADRILGGKHAAGKQDTVSRFLLALAGLSDHRVRINQKGETRELSFRDLARLVLIDEESIIKERSPALSGQHITATAEKSVFRLLLTGIDDSSVVAVEDKNMERGKLAAKTEVVQYLLERASEAVVALNLPGDPETWEGKLSELDALFDFIQVDLAKQQANAAALETARREELTSLREAESKLAVLGALQHRFTLLDSQYRSDLRRLEGIAEAGLRLMQLGGERCPVCGSLATHHDHGHLGLQATPEQIAEACAAEMAKIKQLLGDLGYTVAENASEIGQLEYQRSESRSAVEHRSMEIRELLQPRIQTSLEQVRVSQVLRESYFKGTELHARTRQLAKLIDEINTKGKAPTAMKTAGIGSGEAEYFAKRVDELLRAWHFPNLDRVTFSDQKQDIVISGRERASHGKGVRAIAHAAFNMALLKTCMQLGTPHPGFVIVDSPLVVYREPDSIDGASTWDVKDSFYRSIAKEFASAQIVIFENEDPPMELMLTANVIQFTGSSQGKSGFIPK